MVRFRLLCGDFLLPNQQRTLKTERPSAWDTRRRPRKGEPENAAERGQENHAGRTAHPTSCVQNEHMRLFSLVCIHVDKLSAWILSVLRLTSTRNFVKPWWNLVSADFRYLPDYCNTIALWWVTKTVTHHLEVVNKINITSYNPCGCVFFSLDSAPQNWYAFQVCHVYCTWWHDGTRRYGNAGAEQ